MAINIERFISNACSNSCQSFYDIYVEANVRFRSKLGMKAVIIRRQLGHCCEWCASLAGIYDPSNAPDDIYRRHSNCRCLVTFKSQDGYQDVWNKKTFQTQKQARLSRYNELIKRLEKRGSVIIKSPISARSTSVGKASAITNLGANISIRQKRILETLSDYGSVYYCKKNKVNMQDLAALTAYTGDEFALFTRGSTRMVMRGDKWSVPISIDDAIKMYENGYRWSGHTHPGSTSLVLGASGDDYEILKAFHQHRNVIYNSLGDYMTYELEGTWKD